MKFLFPILVSGGSFFFSVKTSKTNGFSAFSDIRSESSGAGKMHAARKLALGSIAAIIANVLLVGADTKIGESIIHGISVDVIHDHSFWNLNVIKSERDSMDTRVVNLIQDGQSELSLRIPTSGGLIVLASYFLPGEAIIPNQEPKFI